MSRWLVLCSLSFSLYACSPNNVHNEESLQKIFDANKVVGTFGFYDNGQGDFTVYNLSRFKDSAYLPASTFKIVNSLIGLETGKIVNENMMIKWDGIERSRTECNKDLTMAQAFKVSCVPYYQEVARRIGKDTLQQFLDSMGYGSRYEKAVIKTVDSFWLDNTVKITPDEQLGLVKKLYFDQLPFQKRTMRIVRDVMLQETNASYSLSYKTGWGFKENGNSIGWVVGWIVENRHPYMFVLNVEGPHDMDMFNGRLKILNEIFDRLDFKKGKR